MASIPLLAEYYASPEYRRRKILAPVLAKGHSAAARVYRQTYWQWVFEFGCWLFRMGQKLYEEDEAARRRGIWIEKKRGRWPEHEELIRQLREGRPWTPA